MSNFELCQLFVKEAFQKYGTTFEEEEQEYEQLRQVVVEQEAVIIELRKSMEESKKLMSLRRNHQLK